MATNLLGCTKMRTDGLNSPGTVRVVSCDWYQYTKGFQPTARGQYVAL